MKTLLIIASLGLLPAAALAQPSEKGMLARLGEADADHDGTITRAEFKAYRAALFDRLDRNKDGVLTAEDRPRLASKRHGQPSMIERYDANKDGKVDRAEFVDGPTPLFDKIDSNGDGVISKAELEAAQAKAASARAQRQDGE